MAAAFHRAGFEAVDVHMSDILAGRISPRNIPRHRRLRRLLLRRRAGRGRGLGQVDPLQRQGAKRVRAILRTQGHLHPRRVQRLPDGLHLEGDHSRRRALAALRAQSQRAVRGAPGPRAGRRRARPCSSPAWPAPFCPSRWRTAKAAPNSRRTAPALHSTDPAWSRPASSTTTARQPSTIPRTRTDRRAGSPPSPRPTAAPPSSCPTPSACSARCNFRGDPDDAGRRFALAAPLPQRARVGGLATAGSHIRKNREARRNGGGRYGWEFDSRPSLFLGFSLFNFLDWLLLGWASPVSQSQAPGR